MTTRETIVALANRAGAFLELSTTPEKDMAFLLRFAELFYEAGAAAAREPLVEALKEVTAAHEVGVLMSGRGLDKARAALAKATGEKT